MRDGIPAGAFWLHRVGNPGHFRHTLVEASTFIFAPCVHEVDVAEGLERAHPALYIGNDVAKHMARIREQGPGLR